MYVYLFSCPALITCRQKSSMTNGKCTSPDVAIVTRVSVLQKRGGGRQFILQLHQLLGKFHNTYEEIMK